jgi:hypothetical protein
MAEITIGGYHDLRDHIVATWNYHELRDELNEAIVRIAESDPRVSWTHASGVAQIETATVTGGATANADVIVTVTGTAVRNSPKIVNVGVTNGDTASDVAGKIRVALNLVSDILDGFTVTGSSADIVLTSKLKLANDITLNIAIDGTTNATGVPDAANSTNTLAGTAYPQTLEITTVITGSDVDITLPQTFTKSALYKVASGGSALSLETYTQFTIEATNDQLTIKHRVEVPRV